jgi:hypothetical protein
MRQLYAHNLLMSTQVLSTMLLLRLLQRQLTEGLGLSLGLCLAHAATCTQNITHKFARFSEGGGALKATSVAAIGWQFISDGL